MKILIVETNLIWSARLTSAIKKLGHDVLVSSSVPNETSQDIAILNLSSDKISDEIKKCKQAGMFVIAHAGHKETEKMEFGKDSGVDKIVSNSELTFKIEQILEDCKVER